MTLRRLFSSFVDGWPGAALLFMRLVVGVAVIVPTVRNFSLDVQVTSLGLEALTILSGSLLIVGLWTPIAGSTVALLSVWRAVTQPSDLWLNVLLATMGAGLALLGPGAWSIDARLFGWKRIDIREPPASN